MSQDTVLAALEELGPSLARDIAAEAGCSYPAAGAALRRLKDWDQARPIGIYVGPGIKGWPALVWDQAGPDHPTPPRTLSFRRWLRAGRSGGPIVGIIGTNPSEVIK